MRNLRRNETEFEYLPPTGNETDLNADMEHTGDFRSDYGDPEVYRGNISAPSGKASQTFYGEDIRYTHTLVMDQPDVRIKEGGLIRWKGDLYDIQAVRPSLNVLNAALKKQTADNAPQQSTQSVQGQTGGEN